MGAQAVICDITGLFQYRNTFMDINIKPDVVIGYLQVVFLYDILRDG